MKVYSLSMDISSYWHVPQKTKDKLLQSNIYFPVQNHIYLFFGCLDCDTFWDICISA